MPDASTLEGLALRVEQSAGADRTLDGLIEAARDPMRQVLLYNEPGPFPQKAVFGPLKDLVLTGVDLADYIGAPRYTASLDAAMSLIDWTWLKANGFYFSLSQEFYDDHRWTARADTGGDECGTGETIMSGYCDDMVRAVLSFALKALASIAREGGSDE